MNISGLQDQTFVLEENETIEYSAKFSVDGIDESRMAFFSNETNFETKNLEKDVVDFFKHKDNIWVAISFGETEDRIKYYVERPYKYSTCLYTISKYSGEISYDRYYQDTLSTYRRYKTNENFDKISKRPIAYYIKIYNENIMNRKQSIIKMAKKRNIDINSVNQWMNKHGKIELTWIGLTKNTFTLYWN